MKVLQIIDSLPNTSGGARFVCNLSKKIAQRKIEVHVLLIDGKDSYFLDELKTAGITVFALDENTSSRYKPKYVKQIAAMISAYDIVHVHVFPTSYIVALATFLIKKKTPIVFTEHNAYNRRATQLCFKLVEKFMYNRFSKVVGISSAVHSFVKKHLKVKEGKFVVIDNGIDFNTISTSPATERSDLNLSSTDIVMFMAARFADQKDQGTVIRAFVDLPANFKLVFAGDGPNLEKYRKFAESLGVLSRVRFLGARSDIYGLIKMSDINILSSHYEGFGLSAVEAMAAAKPTIVTNVPGVAEVVSNAGLLFNVGDHEKLTSLILQLGTNRHFYEKVSHLCYERSKLYDLEIMTDKYIEVYKEVLKNKNGR